MRNGAGLTRSSGNKKTFNPADTHLLGAVEEVLQSKGGATRPGKAIFLRWHLRLLAIPYGRHMAHFIGISRQPNLHFAVLHPLTPTAG